MTAVQAIYLFAIFPKALSIILFYLLFFSHRNLIYTNSKVRIEECLRINV